MEGNKDEALTCLKFGKDAIEAGDRARALKFLEKACLLDPSLPIDGLFSVLMKHSDESVVPEEESFKPSLLRQRGGSSSSSSSSSYFTQEQRAIVREIKTKNDYYKILGLKQNCSVEDMRKAYRKLSLKVHPDKNKAPGSEEAFKSVSKAFQCLSNEQTRLIYDITAGGSSDQPVYQPPRRRRYYNGFNDFLDVLEFGCDCITLFLDVTLGLLKIYDHLTQNNKVID